MDSVYNLLLALGQGVVTVDSKKILVGAGLAAGILWWRTKSSEASGGNEFDLHAIPNHTLVCKPLSLTSRGIDVLKLNHALFHLGYLPESRVTDLFSIDTQNAVVKFRVDNGLPGLSHTDADVYEALDNRLQTIGGRFRCNRHEQAPVINLSVCPLLSVGDRHDAVRDVKRALHFLGFYEGPIDNYFDDGLRSAIVDLQLSTVLYTSPVNGELNPDTYSVMDIKLHRFGGAFSCGRREGEY